MLDAGQNASSILGWLSIGCWIVVYSPQIVENYSLKSGEGLSILFVVIWLLGDLCNLAGGMIAGLLPTMIILALYYTLCDSILLFQIYYYRLLYKASPSSSPSATETSPLIPDAPTTPRARGSDILRATIKYALLTLFVLAFGLGAWLYGTTQSERSDDDVPPTNGDVFEWKSQVMGWASAVLYLGSRVPQILKNTQTRCEGLSLALFLFAIAGNGFYVLSILVASSGWDHIRTNASWLAGSGLTIFLDIFVLFQFFHFRRQDQAAAKLAEAEGQTPTSA